MSAPLPRKPISKRVRFDVFKRDGFVCQYCGAKPPEVVLEVDHIDPVALGGDNAETNLITSCFNCNRGKAAIPLNVAPETLAERAERVQEAEEQLAGYREIALAREARIEADVWEIIDLLFGQKKETTHARFNSVRRFLERLPIDEVMDAANIARAKGLHNENTRFRYFCGVCWRKVGEREQ